MLANVSQLPFLTGNDAELLIDGEATFKSIFDGHLAGREGASRPVLHHQRRRARQRVRRPADRAGQGRGEDLPALRRRRLLLAAAALQAAAARGRHPRLRLQPPPPLPAASSARPASSIATIARSWWSTASEAWIGGLNVGDEYMGRIEAVRALARHPCPPQGPGGAGRDAVLPRGLGVGDRRGADRPADAADRGHGQAVGPGDADRAGGRARELRHRVRRRDRQGREAALDRQPVLRAGHRHARRRSMRRRCAASMCAC